MEKKRTLLSRERISELLFFVAFIIILFVDYASATYVSLTISGRLLQLAILLFTAKILLTRYSWKEWLLIGALLLLGGVSYLKTDNYFACELFLLIIASKGIDKRKSVKVYLCVVGAITFLAATASILGIFGEVSQLMNFRGPRGAEPELRYCFGYNHPNTCHIVFVQLTLALVWLYYEKMKWYAIALVAVANVVLGLFTDSRTGVLLGSVVFLFLMFVKIWDKIAEKEVLYWLNFVTLAGCLVLSVLTVTVGTTNPLLALVSKLWTGRIEYANIAAAGSGISLLSGADLQISCDMGFVKLFYNYGVLMAIVLLFILLYQLFLNQKRKDVAELMVIFSGMIFLLGEKFSSGEFITRNILVIFMIGMWGCLGRQGENTKE